MSRSRVIKRSIKYGKVPTKLVDETTWNKIYVDLIGPYNILRKGKFTLMMKAVTMIDPVTV